MERFSFSDYIINKEKLIHNVKIIGSKLKQDTRLCAVVKANAYGVGAEVVARAIEPYVDCFAVANLQEGINLRKIEKNKNILTLSSVNLNHINVYAENFLTPPVSTCLEVSKLSSGLKLPLSVNFALNSGMNRIGFSDLCEIWRSINVICKNNKINIYGAFSHLATKEEDLDFMRVQKEKFEYLLTPFYGLNIVRHLSNSNACLYHPELNYDMVRVGFALYGMTQNPFNLQPVVSIKSRVVFVHTINAGESVGYGRSFVAKSDKRIAVVPLGYFDGISRSLSNCGRVIINGRYAPIVGRVCMDSFMVDVTEVNNVDVGTSVIIIGGQDGLKIELSEHAQLTKSSEYEILARINSARMNIIV